MEECWICRKHGAMSIVPGGVIAADEHALVSHLPLTTPNACASAVYLGHLFVEVRRHVAELGELTPDEAASVGRLAALASRALMSSEGAEHVYAAVIGHGIAHLHLHLIARYPGTPERYRWTRLDEWPDAPRGDALAVIALADRLRAAIAA
jgi:diadenosine tetraphosphate (Ap4A) HIT family hydrolase